MKRAEMAQCSVRTLALSTVLLLSVLGCGVPFVGADVETSDIPLNFNDLTKYRDCGHLMKHGYYETGVHQLWKNETTPFYIVCEFVNGTAFNVIQRRMSGSTSFVMPLATYIAGFGHAQSDYWAGLNSINYLTMQQGNYYLTVYLQDWLGHSLQLKYSHFQVRPHDNRYQLIVAGYRGPASLDDLSFSNGATFQTYDQPDPHGCAAGMHAGWWYNYCAYALLNGKYYQGGKYTPQAGFYDGIFWKDWLGYDYSLKFVSMSVSNTP